MDEATPTNETAVDSSAENAGSAAAAPAAGGKTFDKDNQQFLEDIYKNLVKWLDRAGLSDKCTPLLLRAKMTNDMQFIPGELDSLEAQHVLHKMIIRWWKAAGEKRHEEEKKKSKTGKDSKVAAAAASSSSSSSSASKNDVKAEKTASSASREAIKELYQKLRSLAKETNNQALLADVNTLESTEAKVTELRKRFLERAKVNISKSPTEQELKDIRETLLKGGSGDDQPAQKKVKVES
jgi:hypothetical protein